MEGILVTDRLTGTLLRAQFANSLGDGTFYVTSALYFTTVAGLDPAEVRAGLSCAWTVGFLSAAAVGAAADRVGLRGSAVGVAVATTVTLCAPSIRGRRSTAWPARSGT